ncbi:SGNH/GDSL hydrolase family protein [Bifidobacterium sp.]|jgi:lysophospholipase L1-like esterase|uniref:SGNH/GDSL hydrolase family protein n=1 Tax=Bifidobacterium sp. TaxID=41200 RepID=UPI0025C44087|nr:SGNH/GDSL hydrolase family protein [Bifidobacterium sp.]MCI1635216.1 SGNH/GDSL hydrolase family protein [Bifidobacterium sp.]
MVDQIIDCVNAGLIGNHGRQGLPGVNALPTDEAVAEYITDVDAKTRSALNATASDLTAIKNLRERVDAVDFVTNDVCVVIGDSIAVGLNVEPTKRWTSLFCSEMGLTEKNYAVSGTGYLNKIPFANQIDQAIDDTSFDNDRVGLVIVSGGINDVSTNDITLEASKDFGVIRMEFPVAKLMVVPCLVCNKYNDQTVIQKTGVNEMICRAAAQNGADFVAKGAMTWLVGTDSMAQQDNLHPNEMGHRFIASNIESLYNGGTASAAGSNISLPLKFQLADDPKYVVNTPTRYYSLNRIGENLLMFTGTQTINVADESDWIGSKKIEVKLCTIPATYYRLLIDIVSHYPVTPMVNQQYVGCAALYAVNNADNTIDLFYRLDMTFACITDGTTVRQSYSLRKGDSITLEVQPIILPAFSVL